MHKIAKQNYSVEQIITKLREVEVLCSQGKIVGEAVRQIGVSEQTYYRWRRYDGGMGTAEARRLKELEKENTRLKKLVADLSLDNALKNHVWSYNFVEYRLSSGRKIRWLNIIDEHSRECRASTLA